jgi:hypothetical protein
MTSIPVNLSKTLITRAQAFSGQPGAGLGSLPFVVANAVADGASNTPTENAPAIAAQMAALGFGGGTIWFPPGIYQVTNLAIGANVTLRGSHSTLYWIGTQLRAAPGSRLSCLTYSGSASGAHAENVTLIDLSIQGDGSGPPTAPAVNLQWVSYFRCYRCQIGNCQHAALQLTEVWDSRIDDCDFEYCGSSDGSIGAVNCTPGSGDNTNSTTLQHCRFESFFGSCLTAVGNSNKLFVRDCKMESIYGSVPYIILNNAVHIGLDNIQMTVDGARTFSSLLSIVNSWGIFGHVSIENNSGSSVFTNYITITNSPCINLELLIMQGTAAPTSGHMLGWDGLNAATTSVRPQSTLGTPL